MFHLRQRLRLLPCMLGRHRDPRHPCIVIFTSHIQRRKYFTVGYCTLTTSHDLYAPRNTSRLDSIRREDTQDASVAAGYEARGLRDFCEPSTPQALPQNLPEWRTRDLQSKY